MLSSVLRPMESKCVLRDLKVLRCMIRRTIEMAAFVARICGLARSGLGGGGGRATTCGDAASADKSLADGEGAAGTTTGGVSPSTGLLWDSGGTLEVLGEKADIIACRCMGVQTECE